MSIINHPNAPDHWRYVDILMPFYPDKGWTLGYCDHKGEVIAASTPITHGFSSEDELRRWALWRMERQNERHGTNFRMVKAFRFDLDR